MSQRQQQIIEFIRTFSKQHRYGPTCREIGRAVGLSSSSTVHRHLVNLRDKKVVDWIDGSPRTLMVLE